MIGSRSKNPRLSARVAALAGLATVVVSAALLTGCPDKDDGKAPTAAPAPSAQTNTAAKPAASAAEKGGW